jgi:hypothetical protein
MMVEFQGNFEMERVARILAAGVGSTSWGDVHALFLSPCPKPPIRKPSPDRENRLRGPKIRS